MYLVELRPGKEELYRTGDELAAAIRNGDVDMHSRIYHRATSKWISVTLHPQYKAIISEVRPAGPQLPPLDRQTWTFFNDPTDGLAGAHDPEPPPTDEKSGGDDPNQPWRRPLALSVTGGLLILGLQLAASGPRPPWSVREAATESALVVPASAPAPSPSSPMVSLAANWRERGTALAHTPARTAARTPAPTPSRAIERPAGATIAETALPSSAAPVLPAAPKLGTRALLKATLPKAEASKDKNTETRAVEGLVQRWSVAHDAARERLESGIRVARLSQLFSAGRLNPGGGVTETRMSLAGVANFVRVYRQQQAVIDREYQDSFAVAAKTQGWTPAAVRVWYARGALKETPALAGLTSSLLEDIDSLFGVLDAQSGTYTLTKNTIKFEDAGAAREFAALRTRIMTAVDSAKVAGGGELAGPMTYLLQAIGTTRLPLAT
jgi:hypothetical protein